MRKPGNPKIEELTKSHRERSFSLGELSAIPRDGKRYCVWCAREPLKHHNQKYCSPSCSFSAMAWAYPQKEESLNVLLMKQDFKCAVCAFDYTVVIEDWRKLVKKPYGLKEILATDYKTTFSYTLMRRLKSHFHRNDSAHRLEIDHIVPIHKGGLPLDRENLQLCCSSCHKAKTKIDLSGKRKASVRKKNRTKQQLKEEVEVLSQENDALRDVNKMLSEHLDFLQGDKDWPD